MGDEVPAVYAMFQPGDRLELLEDLATGVESLGTLKAGEVGLVVEDEAHYGVAMQFRGVCLPLPLRREVLRRTLHPLTAAEVFPFVGELAPPKVQGFWHGAVPVLKPTGEG